MSLAKQLIGEPVQRAESKTSALESRPIHAMDLIDSLAEQEFGSALECVGKPSPGATPKSAMKKGKEQRGKLAGGKTTKGQVASAPSASSPVKYGKK
jgi:hypothetical protein